MEPTQGLRAFGRAYAAWLSSPEWFRQNLWKQFGAASLKDWLHPPEGTAVFESWDAEDLIAMARIWQSGDIGTVAGGGSYRKALESISSRVLVMRTYRGSIFLFGNVSRGTPFETLSLCKRFHLLSLETCLRNSNSKPLP
jgi:hypothetical protein